MNGQEGDYYDVSEYIPNPSFMGRAEDDESDDNVGAMSGDDDQDGGNIRISIRHTPQQIQGLENFFKECPHPNEQQKSELGRIFNLEIKQIKFWFQNRRTQAKTNHNRHKNQTLREEQELLRGEQEQLKQELMLCSCNICGGPTSSGVVQQLIEENARLTQETDMAKSLLTTPIQLPVSPSPAQHSSSLMISNPESNTPQEHDSSAEISMMNESSTLFVTTYEGQLSPSLMIYNPENNAPQEHDSGAEISMMNESSTLFVTTSEGQLSPSLMIYNPGNNAPQEHDSGGGTWMMNESSTLFVTTSAGQLNAPKEHDSGGETWMMNESSTFFVTTSAGQLNAPQEPDSGGETSMMNESSTFFVTTSAGQPSPSLMISNPGSKAPRELDSGGETWTMNKELMLEYAVVAMNELIMLGETNSSLWRRDSSSKRERLNYEEYRSFFDNGLRKPPGFVVEASRETGTVPMNSLALVKTLTTDKWVNVFAPIVSVAATHRLMPTRSVRSRNGSLKLIEAQFQVISPLVPRRHVKFLRYCKMLSEGLWVVVDVTPRQENLDLLFDGGSNRLPSGLIIQDLTNGFSKVTWIEQAEYDEGHIHQLYQLLISSGIGLGAKRWLTTLQRYCDNLSTLSSINLADVYQGLSTNGATEIVTLANRMTLNYYSGITGSSARKWKSINVEGEGRQNLRLMTRRNVSVRGEHTGIVLNAATSVWFPSNQQTMFDYLSNQSFRGEWDILTNDASIEEEIKIQKSKRQGNCVSLLKITGHGGGGGGGMLVLQETWNDETGALLVYAPVETQSVEEVLSGQASNSVKILPSGFYILPDGGETETGGGCLLTLGFQFLVSSKPTAEVDQDFLEATEELMARTIDNIKSALHVET